VECYKQLRKCRLCY